jgi:hypothetical protein
MGKKDERPKQQRRRTVMPRIKISSRRGSNAKLRATLVAPGRYRIVAPILGCSLFVVCELHSQQDKPRSSSSAAAATQEPQIDRLDVSSNSQTSAAETLKVKGTVVEQKKYSIVVRSQDEELSVAIPNGVPMYLHLSRPFLDFGEQELSVSAKNASADNRRRYALREPLYVIAEFAHRHQYDQTMKANVKRLRNYRLTYDQTIPDTTDRKKIRLVGKIAAGAEPRHYVLTTSDSELQIMLGPGGVFEGEFTILDLKPGETELEMEVESKGGTLTAKTIRFWPIEGAAHDKPPAGDSKPPNVEAPDKDGGRRQ